MEIISALAGAIIGAIVGGLITIIWDRSQIPSRLLNALQAELVVNKELCQYSLEVNRVTLESSGSTGDNTIDDDFKVYVAAPVNIPLETWVNQNSSIFKHKIPIQLFLRYKANLARLEFLVFRHQAFRFRPNFVKALVVSHESLLEIILEMESQLKKRKSNRGKKSNLGKKPEISS
jgi:hypothetical protein